MRFSPSPAPRLVALLTLAAMILSLSSRPAVAQAPARAELSAAIDHASLPPGSDGVLAVVLDVKEGFHAQSHTPLEQNLIKLEVKPDANDAVTFGQRIYPEGHIEEYPELGRVSVYTGRTIVYVPFQVKPDAAPGPLALGGRIRYQICDDKVCFMPENKKFFAEAKIAAGTPVPNDAAKALFADYNPAAPSAAPAATQPVASAGTDAGAADGASAGESAAPVVFGADEQKWSTSFAFGVAIFAGLIFNIMPCVLPVLPLKAVGFYEVSQHRRGQSVLLGVVFSLGMTAVFALLGVLVLGLQWLSWGEMFSKPWFVWPLSIFLLLMAGGLFGAFNVNLPTGVYSFTPRHDTLGGNFFWGALTAIMATPCTAPLLPGLLIWAAAQPAAVGVISMVLVGVGMSLPYLVLSALPEVARKLPRTGPWPDLFKQMMGFAMLAVAVYFIAGRLVHGTGFWWAVVLVLAIACVFLVARTVQLSKNATPLAVSSTIAVVTLAVSIGWAAQVNGMLSKPTAGVGAGVTAASFQPFTDAAFEQARASGRPVLVKFTANWCLTCQYIEGTVFQDPNVWAALGSHEVVALKADLTDTDAPGQDLLLKLNPAGGIPLTAIYSPSLPQPIVLASVYQSQTLLDALEQADESAQASAR